MAGVLAVGEAAGAEAGAAEGESDDAGDEGGDDEEVETARRRQVQFVVEVVIGVVRRRLGPIRGVVNVVVVVVVVVGVVFVVDVIVIVVVAARAGIVVCYVVTDADDIASAPAAVDHMSIVSGKIR